MTSTKMKPHFSRKLLAIPYALFLGFFVIVPLFIIVFYAFTNGDTGQFDFINFIRFFSDSTTDNFFQSSRFMMIMQSSMQSTLYGFLAIKFKTKVDIACFILNLVVLVLFIIILIIKLIGLE